MRDEGASTSERFAKHVAPLRLKQPECTITSMIFSEVQTRESSLNSFPFFAHT